jgi:hypothetical protein
MMQIIIKELNKFYLKTCGVSGLRGHHSGGRFFFNFIFVYGKDI